LADKTPVAIFISGSGTNMAALLYASRMAGAGYEVVLVASNDPAVEGLKLASAEGIATFALTHKGMDRAAHDAAMEAAAVKAGAQMIVLAGYMRILTDEFVERWQGRMLNIHPSLLPKYRGLNTYARALEAGDAKTGASVHLVSAELDAGEVLGQVEVSVQPGDTPETLADRVRLAEHQLYPRVLNEYVLRPYDAGYLLGRIRKLALALPETEERESHGAPAWRTGGKSGKYFAHFSERHHGEPHIALFAKTSGQDEMADLIARDPETFFRPAYYGASGWVGVILNRAGVDWGQVEYWLQRSWRSVAPKRLTRLLDVADEF
jgi:phosphoribosylglycinamide formyltransferase-1